jgi:hypothetical protein
MNVTKICKLLTAGFGLMISVPAMKDDDMNR